ncbi:winged helix-turn-helix transcriptional regulator [Aeromicrobium chenweiae]|uniref:Transcriptional regulator n=1 Tax=Aeromicrobium chenweiae TaxID=2079793 RepID=A0A2S0WQY2_9ACTN|nr:helix-turn-helix domain-containing protein [Aeromicrobium chenweiae]AWB93731.1 transcriptional regulator [Aeromicrobium chenweiae]TGN30420.1 transcriptional regulator [Aeromicrobium chenweiae]
MSKDFSTWPCSLARSVEVFGDSWTVLIARDALQGLTRFDQFQRSLGIARNTLSDRLSKLVEAGFFEKRFYQDNPPRYEYVLTAMGRDFLPVLAALLAWGDTWLDGGAGAPVSLHHQTDHHRVVPTVICAECGQPIVHEDLQYCVGPGYPEDDDGPRGTRTRLAGTPGGPGGRPSAASGTQAIA